MIHGLGHSTFPQEDFVEVCKVSNIDTIIDTRSHPGSAKYPQYNRDQMSVWLPAAGINYEWWPRLGGWRDDHYNLRDQFFKYDCDVAIYCNNAFPKQRIAKKKTVQPGEFGFTNFGFHDYQFFQMLPEFQVGIERLIARGAQENVACICCECCWTRCHRGMIADCLAYLGVQFTHITPRFRKIKLPRVVTTLSEHSKKPEFVVERLKRYHPDVLKVWDTLR